MTREDVIIRLQDIIGDIGKEETLRNISESVNDLASELENMENEQTAWK